MTEITTRIITTENHTEEDIKQISAPMMAYAFSNSPAEEFKPERWAFFTKARRTQHFFVLEEDGKPMASAAYQAMRHNLRGHILDWGGIWGVSTYPEARRKGYAKKIIHDSFVHMNEAGYAITALYAFKESFYERLGFASWPMPIEVKFKPENIKSLMYKDFPGEIERVSFKENLSIFRDYKLKVRTRTHGFCYNEEWSEDPDMITKDSHMAIARRDGEVVGVMVYKKTGDWGDTMEIHPFFYDDPEARYLLLQWIARHIDQVKEVKISRVPPGTNPDLWVADLYPEIKRFGVAFSRVLNVSRLDGLPVAAAEGRFTAQIVDDFAAWNNGVYTFEADNAGVLHVTPGGQPDCTLDQIALAALLYGVRDPNEFNIRGWGDPSPELQATMCAMFPAALPYPDVTF